MDSELLAKLDADPRTAGAMIVNPDGSIAAWSRDLGREREAVAAAAVAMLQDANAVASAAQPGASFRRLLVALRGASYVMGVAETGRLYVVRQQQPQQPQQ
eukprot:m51a1_g11125 hypothetical protein (101) ;mRNA; r:122819-123581